MPFLRWTREQLPDVPLWNPHIMGGRPFVGNAQSARLLAVQPARVSCCRSGRRSRSWPRSSCSSPRSAPTAGAAARHALRRRARRRARLRLRHVLRRLARVAAHEHLRADAVAARAGRAGAATPGAAARPPGSPALVALQFFGGHPESTFHAMFALARVLRAPAGRRGARDERSPARAAGAPGCWCSRARSPCGAGDRGGRARALPRAAVQLRRPRAARWTPRRATGRAKYLGALFLHDYWGRPTQRLHDRAVHGRCAAGTRAQPRSCSPPPR